MAGKYWDYTKVLDGVSIAAPGVRTVLVFAYYDGDDDHESTIYPVLAIQANLFRGYKRPPNGQKPTPSTPEDLTGDGWRPDGISGSTGCDLTPNAEDLHLHSDIITNANECKTYEDRLGQDPPAPQSTHRNHVAMDDWINRPEFNLPSYCPIGRPKIRRTNRTLSRACARDNGPKVCRK